MNHANQYTIRLDFNLDHHLFRTHHFRNGDFSISYYGSEERELFSTVVLN